MKVLQLLLSALREIFDENAYQRFCARHGLAPGRVAYRLFLRGENALPEKPRIKCC